MGGGEGMDSQKLKQIAAAAYEYDRDSRWTEYWSNVLIPPHMASRSDVVDHFKRKFYQRYIDPSLIIEPMATSSPSKKGKEAPASPQSSSAAPDTDHSGSPSGAPGASKTAANMPLHLKQTIQFSVNAWVLALAILAVFPLVPSNISNLAYRLCFLGNTISSLYAVYSLYGLPRAWNSQAFLVWFQSVAATKHFINVMYCIVFAPTSPFLKLALLPVMCQSLEHVVKFLKRKFSRSPFYRKFLEVACVWVELNTSTLIGLSSQAEIGLGFLLIFSLLSRQRNIIQTFMYWQILKLMYHAPATASYHRSTWAKIGQAVNPFVGRYAPFLNAPLYKIQKWWQR